MQALRPKMIIYRVRYGTPVGGRCSVCHRTFDVELGPAEALSEAKERLIALFEQHMCSEPAQLMSLQ